MINFNLIKKTIFFNEKGSSSIEFAGYLLIFSLLCAFLVDMSFSLIEKSRVERVNNSLTQILRERNAFYKGEVMLSRPDLVQLNDIAKTMLNANDNEVSFQLAIRSITFSPSSTKDNMKVEDDTSFETAALSGCSLAKQKTSVKNLEKMAVWGIIPASTDDVAQWFPLYEISLCVPGKVSYFKQVLGLFDEKLGSLYIRNATVPR
nr:tight adherence pilus pseudopilin TadF [uncultured Enterobacter sp.]